MPLRLRSITAHDISLFSRWWRDKAILKVTSGEMRRISDDEVRRYFDAMVRSNNDLHFMIVADGETVGHISLARRPRGWYETQIVIGERNYRDKGIGTRAIKLLLRRARRAGISRIYLEVRPDNLRAIRAYEKSGFVRDRYKQYRNKNLPETLRMVVAKTFGGGW